MDSDLPRAAAQADDADAGLLAQAQGPARGGGERPHGDDRALGALVDDARERAAHGVARVDRLGDEVAIAVHQLRQAELGGVDVREEARGGVGGEEVGLGVIAVEARRVGVGDGRGGLELQVPALPGELLGGEVEHRGEPGVGGAASPFERGEGRLDQVEAARELGREDGVDLRGDGGREGGVGAHRVPPLHEGLEDVALHLGAMVTPTDAVSARRAAATRCVPRALPREPRQEEAEVLLARVLRGEGEGVAEPPGGVEDAHLARPGRLAEEPARGATQGVELAGEGSSRWLGPREAVVEEVEHLDVGRAGQPELAAAGDGGDVGLVGVGGVIGVRQVREQVRGEGLREARALARVARLGHGEERGLARPGGPRRSPTAAPPRPCARRPG